MKLILDTNVWISALLWHGPPHEILKLIEKGNFAVSITPTLFEELVNVLSRPTFVRRIRECQTSYEELVGGIIDVAEFHPEVKIPPVIKNDPEDDQVLACALSSRAAYIVSGDLHLLELRQWNNIIICNSLALESSSTRSTH